MYTHVCICICIYVCMYVCMPVQKLKGLHVHFPTQKMFEKLELVLTFKTHLEVNTNVDTISLYNFKVST